MNNACLITACAVASHNRNKVHNNYAHWVDRNFDIFYKVHFRMYLHFNSFDAIVPCENTVDIFTGIISFAPLKRVHIAPQSLAKQYTFTLYDSKCPNGPDEYIKTNIEKYINSDIWEFSKNEIINTYVEDVKSKYNITLDKSALDYNIQYCWEVEV